MSVIDWYLSYEMVVFELDPPNEQDEFEVWENHILICADSPEEAYENATGEIDRLVALLEQPAPHLPATLLDEVPPVSFESNVPKEKFLANVLKAKEYITAGDIIQVVGSQRLTATVKWVYLAR